MAFTPTMSKIDYKISAFDGGLNTKYTDFNTPANQSPNCLNVEFDDFGAVGTAYGYYAIGSAIASATIDGLHEYVNNAGTRELLAACNGGLHYYNSSTWASKSSAQSICTVGQAVNFMTVANVVMINNGYMNPLKYDGSQFTRVGVSSPTANVASAVCVGAGTLVGTYYWAITGVNSAGMEGNYAVVTSGLAVTSGQVTVTGLPTFDTSFAVDYKNVYRTKATSSELYYLVTSITANATSVTDNVADASLVTAAPTDNGMMPPCKWVIAHRNRVFAFGNPSYPMRLYFSNQGSLDDCETWPSTNYLDVGAGDGEPLTGGAIYGNALILHKNNGKGPGSLWSLYMPDSADVTGTSNWYLDKIPVQQGGVGHKSVALYNDILFFLNRYGGFGFNGQNLAKSPAFSTVGVFPVESLTFNIEPDIEDCADSYLDEACAIEHDNKLWLSVPKGSNATYNNRIYVYDDTQATGQNVGAWVPYDNPPINCFSAYDGDLVGGSSVADGKVYLLNDGRNHNGSAINSYYYTIWITGRPEHQDLTKVWRYLYLWYETSGNWNLNITYWVDFDQSDGTSTTLSLASGGAVFGTAIFGTDLFGGGDNKKLSTPIVLSNAVGKAIQFKFSTNTADQHWKIFGLKLLYNLRRVR